MNGLIVGLFLTLCAIIGGVWGTSERHKEPVVSPEVELLQDVIRSQVTLIDVMLGMLELEKQHAISDEESVRRDEGTQILLKNIQNVLDALPRRGEQTQPTPYYNDPMPSFQWQWTNPVPWFTPCIVTNYVDCTFTSGRGGV